MKAPRKLYKYMKFNANTLSTIIESEPYYSSYKEFNDPLDCNLGIFPDITIDKLNDLLRIFVDSDAKFNEEIDNIREEIEGIGLEYNDDRIKYYISYKIANFIQTDFADHKVLCLSENFESVLMWSHYADQHRGICLEFDTEELDSKNLFPISYGSSRTVNASEIFKWKLEKCDSVAEKIFKSLFYSKAPDWHYEREWRDVKKSNTDDSKYRLTGIYFGCRCPESVIYSIIKLISDRYDIFLRKAQFTSQSFRFVFDDLDPLLEGKALRKAIEELSELTGNINYGHD